MVLPATVPEVAENDLLQSKVRTEYVRYLIGQIFEDIQQAQGSSTPSSRNP